MYFFKYQSASRALEILKEYKVCYNNPSQFNDPFDMQSKPIPRYSPMDFANTFYEATNSFVKGSRKINEIKNNPDYLKNIIELQNHSKTLPIEEVNSLVQKWSLEAAKFYIKKSKEYLDGYFPNLIKKTFVFCAEETSKEDKPYNLLLWSHYAKQHTGVAIKFKQLAEGAFSPIKEKNFIRDIKKPNYTIDFPEPFPLSLFINSLICGEEGQMQKNLGNFVNSKYFEWKYENEIRFIIVSDSDSGKERIFIPFKKDEIEEVYLGLKMTSEDKMAILSLIKETSSCIPIYETKHPLSTFKLEFVKIN